MLTLVVNIYGFIKYSSIHEGNFSDPKDLNKVIQALDNNRKGQKPVIVLDAGIATKLNL
jgi:transposase